MWVLQQFMCMACWGAPIGDQMKSLQTVQHHDGRNAVGWHYKSYVCVCVGFWSLLQVPAVESVLNVLAGISS